MSQTMIDLSNEEKPRALKRERDEGDDDSVTHEEAPAKRTKAEEAEAVEEAKPASNKRARPEEAKESNKRVKVEKPEEPEEPEEADSDSDSDSDDEEEEDEEDKEYRAREKNRELEKQFVNNFVHAFQKDLEDHEGDAATAVRERLEIDPDLASQERIKERREALRTDFYTACKLFFEHRMKDSAKLPDDVNSFAANIFDILSRVDDETLNEMDMHKEDTEATFFDGNSGKLGLNLLYNKDEFGDKNQDALDKAYCDFIEETKERLAHEERDDSDDEE